MQFNRNDYIDGFYISVDDAMKWVFAYRNNSVFIDLDELLVFASDEIDSIMKFCIEQVTGKRLKTDRYIEFLDFYIAYLYEYADEEDSNMNIKILRNSTEDLMLERYYTGIHNIINLKDYDDT